MEFFGRQPEQATFLERLDAARDEGSAVCVHGELGVGKTWFVQRCAELAVERGCTVARGTWYESPLVPAYVGFQECLAQLLIAQPQLLQGGLDLDDPHVRELATLGPEIVGALGLKDASPVDAEDQYGLWRGVWLLLEAACAAGPPVVLVLDDVQWADASSLDLLLFICRKVEELPLIVLGAVRGTTAQPDAPLQRALTALRSSSLVEIELAGLGWKDTRTLIESVLRTPVAASSAQELCEFTKGNPLFIGEIGRQLASKGGSLQSPAGFGEALRQDLPHNVRDVMAGRISALSSECHYLLQLAACVGRNFDLLLLEEIANFERAELSVILSEATTAAVTEEVAPGVLAFSHPLLREVIYAGIPSANRLAIHAGVALALERSYGVGATRHAREIANHLISAGRLADAGRTANFCELGARQARALFAPEEMQRLAQAGIGALERLSFDAPRFRAKLLLENGYAETMLGHPDEALVAYRSALAIYEALGDEEGQVDCKRWIATTLLRFGRWSEAVATTHQALTSLPATRTTAYVALAGAHGLAALVGGRFEEMATWSEKLQELSFDAETKAISHHVAAQHDSWGIGDPESAMWNYDECRANFIKIGHDGTAGQVAADQAVAAYLLGDVERSKEAWAESAVLVERSSRLTALAELCALRTVVLTQEGDWPAAVKEADRLGAMSAQMGGSTIYGQGAQRAIALQHIWRHGPANTEDLLPEASPLRNEPLQAVLLAESGDRNGAVRIVNAIRELVPSDGRGLFWLSTALPLAATLVTLRDKSVAQWLDALQRPAQCSTGTASISNWGALTHC
ncbi:MAG: AAA family ATPase [Chloroflexi bacterium]|nr:AAA family ATPase [Chloroflexota bacterium]MCI0855476.1 AAA family ATPase [Chloroflexota bacterium]MCI0889251.1 AAA family ATPase [Chloroflexota bacterium]